MGVKTRGVRKVHAEAAVTCTPRVVCFLLAEAVRRRHRAPWTWRLRSWSWERLPGVTRVRLAERGNAFACFTLGLDWTSPVGVESEYFARERWRKNFRGLRTRYPMGLPKIRVEGEIT